MTYSDFAACLRALRARPGDGGDVEPPSEKAWFEAILEHEATAH